MRRRASRSKRKSSSRSKTASRLPPGYLQRFVKHLPSAEAEITSLAHKQMSLLASSTFAFTVCFAVRMMFAVIGIPIKQMLGLNETQFGLVAATRLLTGSLIRLPARDVDRPLRRPPTILSQYHGWDRRYSEYFRFDLPGAIS
jgi:hypothetical protein